MNPEEEIKKLREELEYHINRYYNMDSPEISDYEYDMKMKRLFLLSTLACCLLSAAATDRLFIEDFAEYIF